MNEKRRNSLNPRSVPIIAVSFLLILLASSLVPITHASIGGLASSKQNAFYFSGYVIQAKPGTVKIVSGSWFLPSVTCSAGEYSSSYFDVGIDGYGTNFAVLPENGLVSYGQCINGNPSYGLQWSIAGSQGSIPNPFTPGDKLTALVKYRNGVFYLTMKDLTRGWTFSTSGTDTSATRAQAIWGIARYPSPNLSNFGLAQSGKAYTAVLSTDSATIGSHTGSIGSFGSISGSVVYRVTMIGLSSTDATASTLTGGGTSFAVTWLALS